MWPRRNSRQCDGVPRSRQRENGRDTQAEGHLPQRRRGQTPASHATETTAAAAGCCCYEGAGHARRRGHDVCKRNRSEGSERAGCGARNEATWMDGIGDIVRPGRLPSCVVSPDVRRSSASSYSSWGPRHYVARAGQRCRWLCGGCATPQFGDLACGSVWMYSVHTHLRGNEATTFSCLCTFTTPTRRWLDSLLGMSHAVSEQKPVEAVQGLRLAPVSSRHL